VERREFLKLVGVTGAGTMTACDQKVGPQALIPYLVPPENVTPGIPTWYASTCRECPAGCGVHVKTRDGRVIKLEGNPNHPVNQGKLCARGQMATQRLYDPDRLRGPRRIENGEQVEVDWAAGIEQLVEGLRSAGTGPGSIVLLTGLETGTRDRFYDEWAAAVGATRVVYEPFAHEAVLEANRRVFGRAAVPDYDIAGAEFVISFGADFLGTWVSPVRYGRAWSEMHAFRGVESVRPDGEGVFVAVEPRLSMTASNADEWVAARPGTEHLIALAMANVLGAGGPAAGWTPARAAEMTGVDAKTIEQLAELFESKRSLALPGGIGAAHRGATAAAVAVNLLNQAGGAVGDTVQVNAAITGGVPGAYRSLIELTGRMSSGQVKALLVAHANPVFSLPPGVGFEDALLEVPFRVSFSSVLDDTASHCQLLLPDHTSLESWGDWVPEDGVMSLIQPAMRPVFDTRPMPDVLLDVGRALVGEGGTPAIQAESWYDYLRSAWSDVADSEQAWAEALKAGGVWQAAATVPTTTAPATGGHGLDFGPVSFDGPEDEGAFDLIVQPQLAMYDGRSANSPTLQELADPVTTSCWQTWIEIHPDVATGLGVKDGDVVTVTSPHGSVTAPVISYAGIRTDTVSMPLGRGHTAMGRFANGGVNPIELLPAGVEPYGGGPIYQGVRVTLTPTGAWVPPLKHQGSDTQHDRKIAQAIPMAEALHAEPGHNGNGHGEALTVERVAEDSGVESPYRWGMAISLDACTGCNACVAACAAENNIPFVGPERVAKSRQMSWIRIERFLEHEQNGHVKTRHLPMMCQHCGAAPCEPVCPVYAAYHNDEGLNVQVYNRCVGTRYCSNNCPYKVRYFNYFTYEWPEPMNLAINPDVTLRQKGVMEKCTYCVQRINAAKNTVRDEDLEAVVPDGFFQTACQQTCPTDAIVFGNLKDPNSQVSKLSRSPLAYSVLEELNTRPANFYLKAVTERTSTQVALETARSAGEV
jgi:anaerobic selenocysteine-containing dehydrogenase/Fe-S-cluster-containing dehydrogenase component